METHKRYFQAQHLHDGAWWTHASEDTQDEAVRHCEPSRPLPFCNGGKLRVVQVVEIIRTAVVWEKDLEE